MNVRFDAVSFEGFVELVGKMRLSVGFDDVSRWEYGSAVEKKLKSTPEEAYIYVEWVRSGMTGGNCWGGESDTPIEPEEEPNFDELDSLIETFFPNITYIQYKKLVQNVVDVDERENNEYYGNYTIYGVKKANLKKLYDYLKKTFV